MPRTLYALLTAVLLVLATFAPPGTIRSGQPTQIAYADTTHARRTLTAADSARAIQNLADDISALVNLPTERKAGKVGIEVYSLKRDEPLFSLNPDAALTPASTTKLVTTFTALSELGPDHRIRTVIGSAKKPQNGIVEGDLYVKGYGDPFLTVSDVDGLIEQVVASGVKQIDGNVVGDGTFFDDVYDRFEYSGDADEVEPLPPVSALSIEHNTFTVVISSPRTPGQPCNVQTLPRSSGIQIINNAVSAAGARRAPATSRKRGKRKRSSLEEVVPDTCPFDDENVPRYGDEPLLAYNNRAVDKRKPAGRSTAKARRAAAPKKATAKKATTKKSAAKKSTAKATVGRRATTKTAAAKTSTTSAARAPSAAEARGGLHVTVTTSNGHEVVTVSGSLTANRTVSYRYEMKNPPAVTAGLVYDRLRSNGIKIKGTVTTGAAPANYHPLATHELPLLDVLEPVLKHSNNYLAEYTFKIIGGASGGRRETAQRTIEKIHERMNLCQIPFAHCIINDGSGLSRRNCLSASALAGILTAAYHEPKIFDALYPRMTIAGVDGTLRKRMRSTPAADNVHGKTGTLRNTSALAGYVTNKDGDIMTFAMLMNGNNVGGYRAVQDKVAIRLASFSYDEGLQEHAAGTK